MSTHLWDFLFSNRRRYRIGRHVALWVLSLLFFAVVYFIGYIGTGRRDELPTGYLLAYSFGEAAVFLPVHLLLTYSVLYLVIPLFFAGQYRQMLLWLMMAIAGSYLLFYLIAWQIVVPFRLAYNLPLADLNRFFLSTGLVGGLRGGLEIAGLAGVIKLAKHWYVKNLRSRQLEADNLRAELQLLKAQIHPHFLFNTLNNLYALTLAQSVDASGVVVKISNLLRHMLYECNKPEISLFKEVQMLRDYVDLEKARYGPRLEFSLHIHGQMGAKLIAPLLLIPFVENSFKHGASEQLEQAWISLELEVEETRLHMKIMNGLAKGVPEGRKDASLSGGIGLENVQKRLQLLYPDRHQLKIMQEEEIFMVSLMLELDAGADKASPLAAQHKPITFETEDTHA